MFPLEFTQTYTRDDALAMMEVVSNNYTPLRKQWNRYKGVQSAVIWTCAVVYFALAILLYDASPFGSGIMLAGGAALFFLAAAFGPWVMRARRKNWVRLVNDPANDKLWIASRYRIDDQGIATENPNGHGQIFWHAFFQVVDDDERIYFMHGLGAVLVLRKESIAPAAPAEFLQRCRERIGSTASAEVG